MNDETDKPLTEEEMALAQRGEALVKAAVARTEAPQSLREGIERERRRADRVANRAAGRPTRERVPFWRRRWALAGVGGLAIAVLALVLALSSGGGSSAPTYAGIDATATRAATAPAPAKLGGDPPVLDARSGRIQFPDWEKKFGWTATGRSHDEVAGQRVTTVHYRNEKGAELGYSILAGEPVEGTPAGRKIVHEGKTYHLANDPDQTTVTWIQQGQTCVMVAASSVDDSKLIELAASRNV